MSPPALALIALLATIHLAAGESPAGGAGSEGMEARRLLEVAGVKGGLLVHLGCGDGRLTAALHAGDGYLVHGLDTDADLVTKAREHVKGSKRGHIFFAVLAALFGCVIESVAFAAEPPPAGSPDAKSDQGVRRYIYSLHPDGSHPGDAANCKDDGIVILDLDNGCSFVRRIPLPCLASGKYRTSGGSNSYGGRGLIGHTGNKRIYYTFNMANERTIARHPEKPGKRCPIVGCVDVETDKVVWEVYLEELPEAQGRCVGAGNPAITPDGKKLYVTPEANPERGQIEEMTVLDAGTGRCLALVPVGGAGGCGNSMMSPDGKYVYTSGALLRTCTASNKLDTDPATGKPWSFSAKLGIRKTASSHFVIDATGNRMYMTCDGIGRILGDKRPPACAALICSTETGQVLSTLNLPNTEAFEYFRESIPSPSYGGILSHEGSFTPCGRRFWAQAMAEWFVGEPPAELFQHAQIVDNPGPGDIKWVSEWDIASDPPSLVKLIATRSRGHSHAHALVTREGDLLLTGNGYVLDTTTGMVKHAWKGRDGEWFQGTKILQVNFRNGTVDWVGQRHGTGWLYKVPALSENPTKEAMVQP